MANRQIGWSQEANLLYLISGQVDRLAQILASAGGGGGGVSSFNTRTGDVTLLSSDVTTALGYTPANGNLYTTNGTLTGNRTVTMGSYSLSFEKDININSVRVGSGLTGGTSTFVGQFTSAATATGGYNTAVGWKALGLNTTGTYNIAIGPEAAYNTSSSTGNIAIGYQALYSNTGNSNLIAIGTNALKAATSSDGLAIGVYAFRLLNLGNLNTAIGHYAGYNITGGNSLTLVGQNAGYSLTTGDQNTFIGRSAGFGITTGTSNTIIGTNFSSFSATLSNNIIIGDGSGNQRLVIDNSGNAYFGATTTYPTINASAKLEVASTTSGFLPPRMTGAQAEAIASPAAGLLVYANNGNGTTITTTGWWGYNGSGWVKIN